MPCHSGTESNSQCAQQSVCLAGVAQGLQVPANLYHTGRGTVGCHSVRDEGGLDARKAGRSLAARLLGRGRVRTGTALDIHSRGPGLIWQPGLSSVSSSWTTKTLWEPSLSGCGQVGGAGGGDLGRPALVQSPTTIQAGDGGVFFASGHHEAWA